jgi:hypothetical protein
VKIDLETLLQEMEQNGWTSNAVEYVQKAINVYAKTHEALCEVPSCYEKGDHEVDFSGRFIYRACVKHWEDIEEIERIHQHNLKVLEYEEREASYDRNK